LQEGNCFSHEIQFQFVSPDEFSNNSEILANLDFVVVALNIDDWLPDIENKIIMNKTDPLVFENKLVAKSLSIYKRIKTLTNARVLWFGFEDYYSNQYLLCGSVSVLNFLVDKVNIRISEELINTDAFIDLKRIIAQTGLNDAFDIRNKYRWNMPYTKNTVLGICEEIEKQIKITNRESPKCIVLDCDNVLWGGVLSEDGIEGIRLAARGMGSQYQSFQRFILMLYLHGVIIAICSKNDEADVIRVFKEHDEMLLSEEVVSCFKCNWNDKPQNIREISEYLNIGLNSIVFVDDSPFEIDAVKNLLPEVKAILYNKNTIFQELSLFNLEATFDINILKIRTETYKSNAKRELLKSNSISFEDYLKSLEININICETHLNELSRISELTLRTNKCTNGKRYNIEQLKKVFLKHEYELYTIKVSDKFSNLGVVGVVILNQNTIEAFSLSCRALGRNIENRVLDYFRATKNATHIKFERTLHNKDFAAKLKEYEFIIIDVFQE